MNQANGTIDDFSTQWAAFPKNDGFFGGDELLEDYIRPLYELSDFKGKRVGEVGCGNGRFLKIFSRHAKEVVGIEPGAGAKNAADYTKDLSNVEVVNSSIYELPKLKRFDHLFSLGVIHHLPDPVGAVRIMAQNVKKGGKVTIWVYGFEGNELYLATFGRLRRLTKRLPHRALNLLSSGLVPPLRGYIALCDRSLPLPMSDYMSNVLGPLSTYHLKVNIYDQLNPKIAHYWKRDEVQKLMEDAGLHDVRLHHRRGYSWTATGTV